MANLKISTCKVTEAVTEVSKLSIEKDDWIEPLIRKSQKAKEFAYCPYSKFSVGAAVMTNDGTVFTGTVQSLLKTQHCMNVCIVMYCIHVNIYVIVANITKSQLKANPRPVV